MGVTSYNLENDQELARPSRRSPWRYNSPLIQVIIVSIVAFGCPGMFNALTGLGGSGQLDTKPSRDGNIALHAVGAVMYLFVAPVVYNFLGPKWTILVGGFTYPLYAGSLLAYNHIQSYAFVVATSAILGVGSTFFWVSQGAIITSLPEANEKGRMVGLSWFILNIGGVIGSFISMGLNWKSNLGTVSNATYAVFISLMGAGWLSAAFLLDANKVVRGDGSSPHKEDYRKPNVIKSFIAILKIIPKKESLVMIPFFFMSNYFYSYQQNSVNGRLFTLRTRAFNSAAYWLAQMFSAVAYGFLLDKKSLSRRKRGFIAYLVLLILSLAIWGGGLAFQLRSGPSGSYYKNHALDMMLGFRKNAQDKDVRGSLAYAGPFVEYFMYGVFDALWQNLAYWVVGCFENQDPNDEDDLMARYVGLYKSMCGVGQSIAWKVNTVISGSEAKNYNIEFGLNWGLSMFALFCLAPVFLWIKEPIISTTTEETLEEKDESSKSSL